MSDGTSVNLENQGYTTPASHHESNSNILRRQTPLTIEETRSYR